jgi:hypothetical protein
MTKTDFERGEGSLNCMAITVLMATSFCYSDIDYNKLGNRHIPDCLIYTLLLDAY